MPKRSWLPRYMAALLYHKPTDQLGRELRRVRNGRVLVRWVEGSAEEWVKLAECATVLQQELPFPSTQSRINMLQGIVVRNYGPGKTLVLTAQTTHLGWLVVRGEYEVGSVLICRYAAQGPWTAEPLLDR